MELLFPQNVFSAIMALALPDELKSKIRIVPSAMISGELSKNDNAAAFLPSFDLLKDNELYVSSEIGLSFDGELSPSYLVFPENQTDLSEILLRGDVSSNEIILSKIVFLELFSVQPEIKLDTQELDLTSKNYLMCGNRIYNENLVDTALSFADQINQLIEAPYINNILVSKNENLLLELEEKIGKIDSKIDDNISDYLIKTGLPEHSAEFIKDRIGQISFEMTDIEKQALKDLLKLPYFHGMFEDMFDIKFSQRAE